MSRRLRSTQDVTAQLALDKIRGGIVSTSVPRVKASFPSLYKQSGNWPVVSRRRWSRSYVLTTVAVHYENWLRKSAAGAVQLADLPSCQRYHRLQPLESQIRFDKRRPARYPPAPPGMSRDDRITAEVEA
ncbi:MAG: hypothetical protein WBF93_02085 [Pirellulales bacterium]|nr:hypothetical protein [Pirellulales bacterium]